MLCGDVENSNFIIDQTNIRNVLAFYQLSNFFSVPNVAKAAFNYIERCFTTLCENEDFLQVDANLFLKVLASSCLHVHSEREVFDAADSWLNFNAERREKFAKKVLLKVRLPLLSGEFVKNILKGSSSFTKSKESSDYLKETIEGKNECFQNKQCTYFKHRYCNQRTFNTVIFGGFNEVIKKTLKTVNLVRGSDLADTKALPAMSGARRRHQAVFLKGEINVFGGFDGDKEHVRSVDILAVEQRLARRNERARQPTRLQRLRVHA